MWRAAPCPSFLLQCAQSTLPSLLCVLFSSLFIIQFLFGIFFCKAEVNLSRGLCWFIPGVAVGVPHATYLLTCWSASPKWVWSWHLVVREASCFLSVMWHEEALLGWGFGVSEFCLFLVVFFCQVWLQCLRKISDLQRSCCLLPPSSHHLGSSNLVLKGAWQLMLSEPMKVAFSTPGKPNSWKSNPGGFQVLGNITQGSPWLFPRKLSPEAPGSLRGTCDQHSLAPGGMEKPEVIFKSK
jgi:hypothetical protein